MRAIEKLLSEFGHDSEQVMSLLREASDTIAFYRRLLEHYEFDALTGLPGSGKFHEFTSDIESRFNTVGVIFFDVNGLKECNDTKGHQAGDLLLQKAAESILFISNPKTHVFRVGGDEFVAIITDCEEREVDALLAAWRMRLSDLNRRNDGICCRVAAGSAYGSDNYNISDVLKHADERMYEDKRRSKK